MVKIDKRKGKLLGTYITSVGAFAITERFIVQLLWQPYRIGNLHPQRHYIGVAAPRSKVKCNLCS